MKVILSNFYNNYIQTKYLMDIFSKQKNIIIEGLYGNFPYSFFRSEYNSNITDEICLYDDMKGVLKDFYRSNIIIFDFANPYIEKKDFYSRIAKIQYENFFQKENIYVAVGQKEFAEYLSITYPYIKIILNLDYMDFDESIKSMGVISSNLKKLSQINNNLIKIFRLSFYNCCNCNYLKKCCSQDQKFILDYSEESMFNQCNFIKLLSQEEIYNQIKAAKQNKITTILFEPPKQYQKEYYEILNSIFEEDKDDLF